MAAACALVSLAVPAYRDYAGMLAFTLACGAGTTAILSSPRALVFIEQRPRPLVRLGWAVAILGFVGGIGLGLAASFQSEDASKHWIFAGMGLALLGFMTARLPLMAKQVAQSRADLAALKRWTARLPPSTA